MFGGGQQHHQGRNNIGTMAYTDSMINSIGTVAHKDSMINNIGTVAHKDSMINNIGTVAHKDSMINNRYSGTDSVIIMQSTFPSLKDKQQAHHEPVSQGKCIHTQPQ